ncbi:histidine kinase [Georgenia ruanii]|nr:histidine kinase [Georgenia ruanii]
MSSAELRPSRLVPDGLLGLSVALTGAAVIGLIGTRLTTTLWLNTAGALLLLAVGVVGRAIVRSAPRNAAGWVMLVGSVGSSAAALAEVWMVRVLDAGRASEGGLVVAVVASALGAALLIGMSTLGILLFPTGRPPSARWRPVAWGIGALVVLLAVSATFGSTATAPGEIPNPLSTRATGAAFDALLLVGILLCTPAAVLAALAATTRFRHATDDRTRRALRLVVIVAWLWAGSWLAADLAAGLGAWVPWMGAAADLLLPLFAVAAWVGIVRHGLLDIRFVVSRAVAYAALTGVALVVHGVVIWALGTLVAGWSPVGLTVAVAVLATVPLRDRVQRRVNRVVYGGGADPAQVITRLAQRLADAAGPDDALPASVRTLAEVIGLRHAAVEVGGVAVISDGEPGGGRKERVPLPFAGEVIGHLVVESGVDHINQRDRDLLRRLAPHLAATARSTLLVRALRDARDGLVLARDEERRRIRRDLHDGLGPTLAGMVLGIEHALRHLSEKPAVAERALADLHITAQDAVAEVRRLVYALRPPALDALGLAGAIRERAEQLGAAAFDGGTRLPPLPGSVESATYLVALEAMTNAVTHARDAAFRIRLAVGHELVLDVADDGPGLAADYRPGIGIQSMRERADELGGTLSITRRSPRGTLVRLRVPLAGELLPAAPGPGGPSGARA